MKRSEINQLIKDAIRFDAGNLNYSPGILEA